MTIYHFIRHGESEANIQRAQYICGRSSETPLTEKGHQQARQLGAWYLQEKIRLEKIFSSTAVRARETATSICAPLGLDATLVTMVENIEEKDQGAWTGVLRSSLHSPELLAVIRSSDGHFAPPEGESDRQAGQRLYDQLIREIIPASQGAEHVAIVSHGNVIRCMLQYNLQYPVTWENGLHNTSVTSVVHDPQSPEQFQVLVYNRVDHLEEGPWK